MPDFAGRFSRPVFSPRPPESPDPPASTIRDRPLRREEAEDLEQELALISHEQFMALQKCSYLRMSEQEAGEYDRRRIRIGEICALLEKYKSR
jgi:hypothetical protein